MNWPDAVQAVGQLKHMLAGTADLRHHILNLSDKLVEGPAQTADLIIAIALQAARQIALTAGDVVQGIHHLFQRVRYTIADPGRQCDGHQQHDAGYD